MSTDVRWVVAVIDRPFHRLPEAARFWAAVSGTAAQPVKHDRFIELRRAGADDWLLVQGVLDGPSGVHLDFSVDDPAAFVRRARVLGAVLTADHGSWQVLTSPAGLAFCVAAGKGEHRQPVGGSSRVDQVCLDLAPSAFDAELAFWAALTGWPADGARLRPIGPTVIGIVLRRLDTQRPAVAHLHVVSAPIAAARARHERLGATVVGVGPHGTALLDPAGAPYCLEARA